MVTRRRFLSTVTAVGAGMLLPWGWVTSVYADAPGSPELTHFVDPLPIPGVLKPEMTIEGVPHYEVVMSQFAQKLHRDLPPTTLWGYNGTYPGPTIVAQSNRPIVVKWINHLPTTHLLPIDYTLPGMSASLPDVRAVVHVHGGHVPPASDGGPMDWFTPGHSKTVHYPNNQPASTLWFHDHAMALTRLNVYAGLAAFYLITDDDEDRFNLPKGLYEIGLALQDRTFQPDGQLFYPSIGDVPQVHPVWVPEFFGDTPLVNGKVAPYLEVEPRKYRFRILNGCNARFLHLSLSSGQPFYQIGAEGGFLPQPVQLQHLLMTPAERADVILDFSGLQGQTITLTNDAPDPYPGGGEVALNEFMQFRVVRQQSGPDTSVLPSVMLPALIHPEKGIAKVRDITLNEDLTAQGDSVRVLLNNTPFAAPVTEKPKLGTTEIWRLINLTSDAHPIHLHLVQYHVLDRQPFDVAVYNATKKLVFTGPAVPREANEAGLKDTVRVMPGEVTRIRVPFTDYTGMYVYHCHIVEHEDNDMMRPFEVVE